MNKIQIILLLSVLCTLTSAISFSYDDYDVTFWTNCYSDLVAYSDYAKTIVDAPTQTLLGNVFSCGRDYQTSASRKTCETTNSLSTLNIAAQNYYNICIIPFYNAQNNLCIKDSSCADQADKCTACLKATTCNSYRVNPSTSYTSYQTARAAPACSSLTTACLTTLSPILLNACQQYHTKQCEKGWIIANPTDPCYDIAICALSSQSLTSLTIIAVLSFLLVL